MSAPRDAGVELSVVVPVCNEAENVEPLVREIHTALAARAYEMIFVDDGSTDATAAVLARLQAEFPSLRVLAHSFRSGQSAAVASGVRAARAPWIATLDGDGQIDPADIPSLLAHRDSAAGPMSDGLLDFARVGLAGPPVEPGDDEEGGGGASFFVGLGAARSGVTPGSAPIEG